MSKATIAGTDAWMALDSRGRPTVACRVLLSDGAEGIARVPSGASAGSHEALELRDGGDRFGGRGVERAIEHVRSRIAPAVLGIDPSEMGAVDEALVALDPSAGFQDVGANAVLSVSVAAELAAAASQNVSLARRFSPHGPLLLPMPMVNIVSGGAHAGGLLDVQDFLVIPGARSPSRRRSSGPRRSGSRSARLLRARIRWRCSWRTRAGSPCRWRATVQHSRC